MKHANHNAGETDVCFLYSLITESLIDKEFFNYGLPEAHFKKVHLSFIMLNVLVSHEHRKGKRCVNGTHAFLVLKVFIVISASLFPKLQCSEFSVRQKPVLINPSRCDLCLTGA